METNAFAYRSYVMFGVEDLKFVIASDVACANVLAACNVNGNSFGAVCKELCCDAFNIQNDLANIFFYAGDGRDFVKHIFAAAGKLDAYYGNAGKRAEKYAAKRVTDSCTVTSFKRLNYERTVSAVFC
jgi:hypothetical protein